MSLKHSKTIEEVSTHLNDTAIKILDEKRDPKKCV